MSCHSSISVARGASPRVCVRALFLALALAHAAFAAGQFPSFPPTEPADAAKTFRVKHGFTLDLIAAEPLITSPVAVCYDEDGAAYVVEMRDYPYTDKRTHQAWKENTTDAAIGRISKLIDRDGDGVFDESHVFAEGLSWPTGVCLWRGGIFVTATPDIWYLKDTDGDHRADVREKVFTGFRKYNVQAVINNPLWSLDNRIVIAGATNGAQVRSLRRPEAPPLRVARNDLRIDPRTGAIEAIAGGARFGHGMDDWGNRFLCNIRNPAQHVVFDGTLAARNPLLPVPNPVHDARTPGDTLPVKRISPIEPWRELRARRWVTENNRVPRSELVAGGVFTSAAGITIYRGAAYPKEYYGQAFVAEVANNVVQRQTVEPVGVTFTIETADTDAEFIASTDLWFRPVNFVNAPDGTLHVVDMYRETIEHPWSIPDDIHARIDLLKGRDRGRIYRLSPPGFKPTKPPRLGSASTTELVATLENANSWWRETAQRLLFERQDTAAIAPLRSLFENSGSELARLHALYALDGLGALRDEDLQRALGDGTSGIREHAVRLAAPRLGVGGALRPDESSADLRTRVFALARDPEIRVRYHVAFAAGGVSDESAVAAACDILRRDAGDKWVRTAALSAPPAQCARIAARFLANPGPEDASEVVRQLMFVAGARHDAEELEMLYAAYLSSPHAHRLQHAFWAGLGDGLRQAGRNFRAAGVPPQSALAKQFVAMLDEARAVVLRPDVDPATRIEAMHTLAYDDFASARRALAAVLEADEPQPLQLAAVKALGAFTHRDVATTLLEPWSGYTPAVREEVLGTLLARRERVAALVEAIENKVVGAGQVSGAHRTQLLSVSDATLKARAEKTLGHSSSGSRAEALEKYRPALALAGDAARGARVYDNACAACHRFAGRGVEIGPNLESVRGWDREKLLLNILDPNREVAANYIAYTIDLKDGSSLAGMITEETAGSIKLRRIGAPEETILRQNIAKIASSAVSLMPEGLEAAITPQEMADLLAYLLP